MSSLVVAMGCAAARPAVPRTVPILGFESWELPMQRLYRAEVARGDDGRSSFRLVLRIWRPERFEIAATDPLGRALWQLEVDGDRGRIRNRREGSVCVFDPERSMDLPNLRIPLPASELAAVLAGRLPIPSAAVVAAPLGQQSGETEVASGGMWRWQWSGGRLVGWSRFDGGVETLNWRWSSGRMQLRVVEGDVEIAWTESAAAVLRTSPAVLPARAENEMECRDGELP